ncbi:hypothetical protein H4R20_000642 [Coemansia guatemalensis]|uniref:valine--tRNA ligase n=1 Tax=Coemansia guatemalensis TaxID=2761395 RepID=A0A9W8LWR1_9FUNG|nr:hypothetical protein H4R20_000642 [Coemansia guatemalensis]
MGVIRNKGITIGRRGYVAPVHTFEKYCPETVESDWYEWWQRRGLFMPKQSKGMDVDDKFTMLLPPPNVTGVLHIGHALTLSIQDALARWSRMHGKSVNWVPGADHAGISMQSVVEKKLWRDSRKSRHDLGREQFSHEAWKWLQVHGSRIKEQTVRLGASLNWEEEYFTMDSQHSQVVCEAFIRLYDAGLIYRDTKMVNWSCALQSVISDIEVDKIPTEGQVLLDIPGSDSKVEFGVLHAIEFPIINPPSDGPSSVRVETTRPETMLGDVALAINSSDTRYSGLDGLTAMHPILKQAIPIVCDDVLVDPEFGTGVVKVTPAHDESDYACAQRHDLPIVRVFGTDGAIVNDSRFADYAGIGRWKARQIIIDALSATGAYLGKRDAGPSFVPKCSRSGDIIEPMLMPQWYIRCRELAQQADGLVQSGGIRLVPDRQRATWHSWMSNIEDWCVSRQLWWGHRIPAYQVSWSNCTVRDVWVAAASKNEAIDKAFNSLSAEERATLEEAGGAALGAVTEDEDVLDTWFSAGLLPLTAFNFDEEKGTALLPARATDIIRRGALSSLLETGQDILFFWVARMAMLCTYFARVPPFATALMHPMVRDMQGRKMSKSLGNIINPIDIIDGAGLPKLQQTLKEGYLSGHELERSTRELKKLYPTGFQKFGADALRFTLLLYTQQTQQINMSVDAVKASYHFCNKLWNTFRFVHMHASKLGISAAQAAPNVRHELFAGIDEAQMTVFDRALLSRLHYMLETYQRAMATYRFAVAAEAVRDFVHGDLCDRYIEVSKLALFGKHATGQVMWAPGTAENASLCLNLLRLQRETFENLILLYALK